MHVCCPVLAITFLRGNVHWSQEPKQKRAAHSSSAVLLLLFDTLCHLILPTGLTEVFVLKDEALTRLTRQMQLFMFLDLSHDMRSSGEWSLRLPLLETKCSTQYNGWFLVYDTMHHRLDVNLSHSALSGAADCYLMSFFRCQCCLLVKCIHLLERVCKSFLPKGVSQQRRFLSGRWYNPRNYTIELSSQFLFIQHYWINFQLNSMAISSQERNWCTFSCSSRYFSESDLEFDLFTTSTFRMFPLPGWESVAHEI